MTTESEPIQPEKPPKPIIKKMRWPFPFIWIVPIVAACAAGYFLYQNNQEKGVEITIQFDDVTGIKPSQTTVSLRGVTIGHVKDVQMSDDHLHVITRVDLQKSAEFLAHADTLFWLVRPEVSLQNVTGLGTIISGPYIDCRPGDGPISHSFIGLSSTPTILGPGIMLILSADTIGQLNVDSPVSYRGIQVGQVKDVRLSNDATAVNATVFIWDRYKSLVRSNTQFWLLKGADLQGSLFGGVKLKLGSVQNILSGGIGFATPETNYGQFVADGTAFHLHDQPKDEWLKWKASIQLPADATSGGDQKAAADANKKLLPGENKN